MKTCREIMNWKYLGAVMFIVFTYISVIAVIKVQHIFL
jgi:hypothetical protein